MNWRFEQRKWVRGSHTSMSTTLQRRGGVPQHAFCQALYKGNKGEDWGEDLAVDAMDGEFRSRRRLRKQKPSGK